MSYSNQYKPFQETSKARKVLTVYYLMIYNWFLVSHLHHYLVLNKIRTLLICIFIFTVAGGHWGMMQVIAWSEMSSQGNNISFIGAIFSDSCELCHKISEERGKEKKDPQSSANVKNQIVPGTEFQINLIYSPQIIALIDYHSTSLRGINLEPATGPPQSC